TVWRGELPLCCVLHEELPVLCRLRRLLECCFGELLGVVRSRCVRVFAAYFTRRRRDLENVVRLPFFLASVKALEHFRLIRGERSVLDGKLVFQPLELGLDPSRALFFREAVRTGSSDRIPKPLIKPLHALLVTHVRFATRARSWCCAEHHPAVVSA